MTISNTDNNFRLEGDGATTSFPFSFPLLLSDYSDLYVYKIDIDPLTLEETETLLVIDTDYTVTPTTDISNNILGGSVDTLFTPTTDQDIYGIRTENLQQNTELEINQRFPEKVIEKTFDKLTLIVQQQKEEIDRALKLGQFTDITISSIEKPVDTRALVFSDNGDDTFDIINSEYNPDEQVENATAQVVLATNQAIVSTAQAVISTEQAVISTEQASLSEDYKDESEAIKEEIRQYVVRSIGEIVQSTTPLSDAGLHLLDGTLLLSGGSYDAFITAMETLVSTYPLLFTTETLYQEDITNFGGCEKYVSTTGVSLRLPTAYNKNRVVIDEGGTAPSFWRLYNDGWIEQGGVVLTLSTGNGTLITLPIPYTNTNYNAIQNADVGTALASNYYNSLVQLKTVNNFYIKSSGTNTVSWTAKGYGETPNGFDKPDYTYLVVATSVKTDIVVDIDDIATDLGNKADKDLSNITSATIYANDYMAPKPTAIAGVGQMIHFSGVGQVYTLPAGGTWVVWQVPNNGDINADAFSASVIDMFGIFAGGTVLTTGFGGIGYYNGLAWRIA